MESFVMCSFYTEGEYEDILKEYLLPSLKPFNISYYHKKIGKQPDWFSATRYKPAFALECLEKYPGSNIVLIDVDARVNRYPELFREITEECLLGFYQLNHKDWYKNGSENIENLTGTLFIKNTPESKLLVKEWVRESTGGTDQNSFDKIIEQYNPTFHSLPLEYCYITSLPWGTNLI